MFVHLTPPKTWKAAVKKKTNIKIQPSHPDSVVSAKWPLTESGLSASIRACTGTYTNLSAKAPTLCHLLSMNNKQLLNIFLSACECVP